LEITLDWLINNKEWFFSGIGIAVPIAIIGWYYNVASLKDKASTRNINNSYQQPGDIITNLKGENMKIGKDSVVMGNVPSNLEAGEGCVIIGATDERGNTSFTQTMAVGRNAQAGPDSIAIGAGAGANAGGGINLVAALHELSTFAQQSNNQQALSELTKILSELNKQQPDKSFILKSWDAVKALGSINGAHALLSKISIAIAAL
jgi:hypothetical protein